MVLSFLYKCVRVFCEYFKELEEESIRDNFVIVYELLDELMDFGFPQSTDSKILQEYITQEGHKLEEVRPPPALTQTVSWRSDGLKYRKNEVFLDVIESVNLLVRLFRSLAGVLLSHPVVLPGQFQRQCSPLGDQWRDQDARLSQRHAGTTSRSQRQSSLRNHGP